ncbi:FBD-associated F-box protein At5g38590-like [Lotus japonicus]|uniref:FBD-associated F-box protein At5g38590-like n=1 Tax=Lotus japonicus TaxID=34305 RepID=UPI00258D8F48|nr:FBD-associated F-box protein At5g38590-like [Lotus japonicus]
MEASLAFSLTNLNLDCLSYIEKFKSCSPLKKMLDSTLTERSVHLQPIKRISFSGIASILGPLKYEIVSSEELRDVYECLDKLVPFSIFSCRGLVVLKLKMIHVDGLHTVDCPSLKTLHLNDVDFSEDWDLVELLSGCPVLEDLELHHIHFLCRSYDDCTYKIPELVWCSVNYVPVFSNLTHLELIIGKTMRDPFGLTVFDVLKNCPKLQNLVVILDRIIPWCCPVTLTNADDEVFHYPDAVAECVCSQSKKCTLVDYTAENNEKRFAELNVFTNYDNSVSALVKSREKLQMLKDLSMCPRRSAACVVLFK